MCHLQSKLFIVLAFLLFPFLLLSQEVSFKDLKMHEGQIVTLKGFLYKRHSEWILAEYPNLKSCCLDTCEGVILKDFSVESDSFKLIRLTGQVSVKEPDVFLLQTKVSKNPHKRFFLLGVALSGVLLVSSIIWIVLKFALTTRCK